jgi:hypothetical protein
MVVFACFSNLYPRHPAVPQTQLPILLYSIPSVHNSIQLGQQLLRQQLLLQLILVLNPLSSQQYLKPHLKVYPTQTTPATLVKPSNPVVIS